MSARTGSPRDIVDITDDISNALAASGIADGHVVVSVAGSTCALVVNERESGLLSDIQRTMERVETASDPSLTIGAPSIVLPAADGQLRLGTWQRVLLVELAAGGERSVTVRVEGE